MTELVTTFQSRDIDAFQSNSSGLPSPLVSTCDPFLSLCPSRWQSVELRDCIAVLAVLSEHPLFQLNQPVHHAVHRICCHCHRNLMTLTVDPLPSVVSIGVILLWISSTCAIEPRQQPRMNLNSEMRQEGDHG